MFPLRFLSTRNATRSPVIHGFDFLKTQAGKKPIHFGAEIEARKRRMMTGPE